MEYRFKLILIGPGSVGKTSLIHRFVHNKFSQSYKTTIGVDLMDKVLEFNNKTAKLMIWDIGGQERFKFMRKNFYRGTNGALLIFDLTREYTFQYITKKWYPEMLNFAGPKIPFLLIGNKVDLVKDVGPVIDANAAKEFAESKGSIYIETSAKTGDNVEDAFVELTKKVAASLSEPSEA